MSQSSPAVTAPTTSDPPWAPAFVRQRIRDLLDLSKSGITTFVVLTTGMALWLAPGSLPWGRSVLFLLSTALLVASANMVNCWMERETDALMRRTRNRPIPAGRVDGWSVLALAVVLVTFALPLMVLSANRPTAALGLAAFASYVFVYTPLKRRTPRALEAGTLPGALPVLMGWTAAEGNLAPGALALFLILVFWQLPHFVALAISLQDDYRRAGIQVLPVARGDRAARRYLFVSSLGLLVAGELPYAMGLAGPVYATVAALLGLGFAACAWKARDPAAGTLWTRRTFLCSLVYLPAVYLALLLGAR